MNNYRLNPTNIDEYVVNTYKQYHQKISKKLLNFYPILQADYGGEGDCTIASMAALCRYREKKKLLISDIYNEIEKIAFKFGYRPNSGMNVLWLKPVLNKYLKKCTKTRAFKNIGMNWTQIKNNIEKDSPMVLSITNDGRNYYRNHCVVVVGYTEYDNGAKIIIVYDNWQKQLGYVDYNRLHINTRINWI